MTDRLNAYAPYFLSVLRIVAALLFIAHGTGKYFGFPAIGMPTPTPLSLTSLLEIVLWVRFVTSMPVPFRPGTRARNYPVSSSFRVTSFVRIRIPNPPPAQTKSAESR